jgi:hypothetical protein
MGKVFLNFLLTKSGGTFAHGEAPLAQRDFSGSKGTSDGSGESVTDDLVSCSIFRYQAFGASASVGAPFM